MELNDAFAHFGPTETLSTHRETNTLPDIYVGLLTENSELNLLLQGSLQLAQIKLCHQIRSIKLIERVIEKKFCDVAIIDIEREDEWPGSVFSRFDEKAASFPIILLCKKRHKILDYRWKAQHAVDIFSHDIVSDPRFCSIIQAAMLRAEATEKDGVGDDWNWLPPAA